MSRLTSAIDECQTKLNNELTQGAAQLHLLRSLLSDVEAVMNNFAEKRGGHPKTHEKYYQKMTGRLSRLNQDLNSCIGLCDCFQADVSKSDVNRIVGEIGKLTLMKKHWENEKFLKKKDFIANNLTSLLADERGDAGDSGSEASLEGSCSVSSEADENGVGVGGQVGAKKPQSEKVNKSRKLVQNNTPAMAKSNKNNANATKTRKKSAKSGSAPTRPNSGQISAPAAVKRNAQGAQSASQKRADLFHFKGVSRSSDAPFLIQPGLLGPRPNAFPFQGAGPHVPFRFSHLVSGGQKQQTAHPNFSSLSQTSHSGFRNANFNFSSSQPRSSSFDFIQNSPFESMNLHPSSLGNRNSRSTIGGQVNQSRTYHIKQDQAKEAKKSGDSPFGFSYPRQQNSKAPVFGQKSKAGLMGSHPLQGVEHGSIEQQLNEMAQKIRQMQHVTSQNFQLQQLMQETERLKQLIAQKQNQHQDRFQYQFQLLINAFMQQQQQQQSQGSQSKVARSAHFQNQKQQQHQFYSRQQQNKFKKQKQQQNRVQQEKQEPQQKSPRRGTPQRETNQVAFTEQAHDIPLQNGENFTQAAPKLVLGKNSKVMQIGTFSPDAPGDKHRAGVSSIVVIENIGCVVVVDIINGCLKLYNVSTTGTASGELSHSLVTRLELSRPYYMSQLSKDLIVVSREEKLLSLIRVSRKRLEFLHDIRTESQYYGLGYVRDNLIVCAAFADNRIDLLSIHDGVAQTAILVTQCRGPELVTAVPSTGYILYLERVLNETVRLLGISQQSIVEFSVDLESSPTDVWSIVSVGDRIVCANKQSGKVKLFSDRGMYLADVIFPAGAVNQPFAMAFSDSGYMYMANDGAWDSEFEHYITTDINVYMFS